jgi:alpha-tubulin suppressor-like RCC1 family protein
VKLGAVILITLVSLALAPSASPELASSQVRRLPAGFVETGADHTCAVLATGAMRCWGYNIYGELGYGNRTSVGDNEAPGSVGPVDLGQGRRAVAIGVGYYDTCALLDNGRVRCWGDGILGKLGLGDTRTIGDDETPGTLPPVDLGAGRRAVAISVGANHSCALLDNGRVRCWGYGASGQLGYGNTSNIGDDETPGSAGPVDLGPGRKAVAVSAGGNHTCALLEDHSVRCWGEGASGQLGYGNTSNIGDDETPGSAGSVDLGPGRTAVAISAGYSHTCALLDNGRVRCWGLGSFGRLGYGNTATVGDDETPGSVGTVDLGAGRTAIAISAGTYHTCALLDNGRVRCWGLGSFGRLGYGNTATVGDDETPGSVGTVYLGRKAVAISAGNGHSCALLDNGRVRCWGFGDAGRLGYGNTDTIGDDETPVSVGPVNAGGLLATKVRPALSFALRPTRDGSAPYTLHASGRLSGFLADRATCSGLVQVRATTTGLVRVRWRKLKLGAGACTYAISLSVPRRGGWKVTAAFPGNGSLKGRTAPARRFRAG